MTFCSPDTQLSLLLFVLAILLAGPTSSHRAADAAETDTDAGSATKSVTVLGLGMMGKAMSECFASRGYQVHAWNRGEAKRTAMRDAAVDGVTVYDDARQAVEASDTVVVMFASEPNLKSVRDFVESLPDTVWKKDGKALVNFASQEPYAAKELEKLLESLGVEHVGGAMIAVPETICTEGSVVLTSAPDRSQQALERVTPTLQALGRLETFEGDVGYGSLVDIALIQTLFFGMTGYELSLLFLEKYGVPQSIIDRFVDLSIELFPLYFPHFFRVVGDAIINRNWKTSYMTTEAMVQVLEMHGDFLKKIGIADDGVYNSAYLKHIKKLHKSEPDSGCSAVVKHYSKDKFRFVEKVGSEDEL